VVVRPERHAGLDARQVGFEVEQELHQAFAAVPALCAVAEALYYFREGDGGHALRLGSVN
jgi:hypothetical protein